MTTQKQALFALFFALSLAACTKDEAPKAPPVGGVETGGLAKAKALIEASLGPGREMQILAFASDGSVVYGRAHKAPPNSDATIAFDATWLSAKPGSQPVAIDLGPIQGATIAPSGDRIAVVTSPSGALHLWSPGATEHLDDDAKPGVSFSADGARLVYAKGPAPELDIYAVTLENKQKTRLTDDPAPDYLPALSPDGETLAFVSTRSGTPAVWVAGAGGEAPKRLSAERFPAPDGLGAPLFGTRAIVYFDGSGVVAIDASTGAPLESRPGATLPHFLEGDLVGFEQGGTLHAMRLSPLGGAQ